MDKLGRKLLLRKIVYILHCLAVLFLAYLLNKFFQMLWFLIFFNLIQSCFNYRFHTDTIIQDDPIRADNVCKLITIVVELLYLAFCKDLNVSVYSNLFVILIIATINALLQFTLERMILHNLPLHNKDKLIILCAENNISKVATNRMIQHYIEHKSIKDIAADECVEIETIKQSIRRTKRKLHI